MGRDIEPELEDDGYLSDAIELVLDWRKTSRRRQEREGARVVLS